MISIDFRVMYPSLSRLAIWIERIAVKVESHDIQYIKKTVFIFYHKSWLARFLQNLRVKVNVIEFILKHYIS